MKICVECEHFIKKSQSWYHVFCGNHKRENGIDPISGDKIYKGVNDSGTPYFTDEPYKSCKEGNPNGECCDFKLTLV